MTPALLDMDALTLLLSSHIIVEAEIDHFIVSDDPQTYEVQPSLAESYLCVRLKFS
jgi:hypothetical protein